jgi:type IV pilus assembly protein PilN
VILVNLLPHREAARKRRREVFFATLGVAALVGGLICGAVYSWYLAQIESQRSKNNFLKRRLPAWKARSRTSPPCRRKSPR